MTVYHGKDGEIEVTGTPSLGIVGYVDSISFDVTTNREGKREIGSKTITHFKSGNLEITGSLERYWMDNQYLSTLTQDNPPLCDIKVTLDDGSTANTATLTGVTFTDSSHEVPSDDIVTESLDFEATDVTF